MSKQCLYIEQAKHLQELGVEKSNSDVFWFKYVGDEYVKLKNICKCGEFLVKTKDEKSITQKVEGCEVIPTFTLQDILDLLPKEIHEEDGCCNILSINAFRDSWYIRYGLSDEFEPLIYFESKVLIDAAYEMLCWVLTNKYIQ